VPLLAALLLTTACGGSSGDQTSGAAEETEPAEEIIVNVACRNDYPEIWDAVNKELEDDGIVVVNTGYDTSVNLNELLVSGDIDMNVAQHYAYLDLIKAQGEQFSDLVPIGAIHISTLDLYSNKYDSIEELPDGATVSIPNDVMNAGRAILVLERMGLVTLDDNYDIFPDETNIAENPKNLKLLEIASDSMVITLDDVDAGFVYSVNAVDAGLDPIEDPIYRDEIDFEKNEGQDQFIIIFTARGEDADNEIYKKVVDAYHSDSVYKVYKDVYKNSIIPVVGDEPIDLSQY
jgi:D-methionine transport system substrate-binding protein